VKEQRPKGVPILSRGLKAFFRMLPNALNPKFCTRSPVDESLLARVRQ
jgi:hypothetical protein